MAEKEFPTQSVVFDPETREQLSVMAKQDDRTNSALIRTLIRQEYARRFSSPNPAVTIEQATTAAEAH
jgi:predicted transcriptional regulator